MQLGFVSATILQSPDDQLFLLLVRFSSAKLTDCVSKWFPCKEEAAGAVIAINQCRHCINESDHVTLVRPNCQPVVNAVNLIKAGRYSSNLRLQSLLSTVNRSNVHFFTTVPDQDYASSMFMLAGSGRAVGPETLQYITLGQLSQNISLHTEGFSTQTLAQAQCRASTEFFTLSFVHTLSSSIVLVSCWRRRKLCFYGKLKKPSWLLWVRNVKTNISRSKLPMRPLTSFA